MINSFESLTIFHARKNGLIMTKKEIMDKYVSFRMNSGTVPSMLEFIQGTDVTVDDLQNHFPTGNVYDSFAKMANECSEQW